MFFTKLVIAAFVTLVTKADEIKGQRYDQSGSSERVQYEKDIMGEIFEHYGKEIRPRDVVNVSVQFHLLTINDLDTKSQTLTTTGYFELAWTDARLGWNVTDNDVRTLFTDETMLWVPPLVISNAADQIRIISDEKLPIRLTSAGKMKWMPPLLMKTYCEMDIAFYPVDKQTCKITMMPWGYYREELDLQKQVSDTTNFTENGEWKLISLDEERTTYTKGRENYSNLVFTFVLARRPMYYIFNFIIPSLLMTFLSPIVFYLPTESGERMSYIITVFLAFAVMLTMVSDQLPPSSITPSIFSLHLTLSTLYTAIVTLLTLTNLRIFHNDGKKPVSKRMFKLAKLLKQHVLCRRRNAQVNTEENEAKSGQGRNHRSANVLGDVNLSRIEIAEILDVFYFRVFMILACVQTVVFVAILFHNIT